MGAVRVTGDWGSWPHQIYNGNVSAGLTFYFMIQSRIPVQIPVPTTSKMCPSSRRLSRISIRMRRGFSLSGDQCLWWFSIPPNWQLSTTTISFFLKKPMSNSSLNRVGDQDTCDSIWYLRFWVFFFLTPFIMIFPNYINLLAKFKMPLFFRVDYDSWVYIYHISIVHSLAEGHLVSFHSLDIIRE